MPFPAQFQLGLELTNIVNPLSQAVSAIGSLALVEAIKKAGSDVITEMKLASLIGRHRIDEVIKWHFREKVSKADRSVISRYMDIVLESGAGPTVLEAMKNPALFSMVIQLSALAFAHEDESLASAIVEAIERTVKESGASMDSVPDYVSLLGTIRACQQQTAAFQWASVYESIEWKIRSAPKESRASNRKRHSKRRKIVDGLVATPVSVERRALPFPVLQCLIMWLQSLQSFPEHRFLHLRCNSGISTAVLWCHHLLGLTVTVDVRGLEICFGEGPSSVFIEDCDSEQAGASLMDPADRNEPLFKLSQDGLYPDVSSERRAEAFGFGRQVLKKARLREDSLQYCAYWVIARCISISEMVLVLNSPENHRQILRTEPSTGSDSVAFRKLLPSRERFIRAGRFLFALETTDEASLDSCLDKPLNKTHKISSITCNLPALILTLIAFAQIDDADLKDCAGMPLSLVEYHQILGTSLDREELVSGNEWTPSIDLICSFRLLSQLLLGHMFSEEYFKPAVLVSAWGWSVFLDVVDAIDPTDVSTNTIRVVCGVPSRRGLRRSRIIDGPTTMGYPNKYGQSLSIEPEIKFFPGESTAQKDLIMVGHHSDAFLATQTFHWKPFHNNDVKHKLGFREMLELCLRADILPPCACEHVTTAKEFETWLDERAEYTNLLSLQGKYRPPQDFLNAGPPFFEIRYKCMDPGLAELSERVFIGMALMTPDTDGHCNLQVDKHRYESNNIWSFYVGENPAARWLRLDDLCTSQHNMAIIMRSNETCFKCASDTAPLTHLEPASVIL